MSGYDGSAEMEAQVLPRPQEYSHTMREFYPDYSLRTSVTDLKTDDEKTSVAGQYVYESGSEDQMDPPMAVQHQHSATPGTDDHTSSNIEVEDF
jgi:hypothetical protein